MTGIIIACGGALIAAFVSILTLLLNRKWQKEDRTTDRLTELSEQIDDLQRFNPETYVNALFTDMDTRSDIEILISEENETDDSDK